VTEHGAFITILPDGTVNRETRSCDARPKLAELQAAVGGLIQPVDYEMPPGYEAFANEEGLLMGLEKNPVGMRAVKWPEDGLLVGPIVILYGFNLDWDYDEDEDTAFASTKLHCYEIRPEGKGYRLLVDDEADSKVFHDMESAKVEVRRRVSPPGDLEIG